MAAMSPNGNEVCCDGESKNSADPITIPLLPPKPNDGAVLIDIPARNRSGCCGCTSIAGLLTARFSGSWFLSPFSVFRRAVDQREVTSLSVAASAGVPRKSRVRFLRRIDWVHLWRASKVWMKNPLNVALLLWLICVACFLSLLFLLLTELVNGAFPTTASRKHWVEICNQVLNALFTLMSLYQHPKLVHHLVLLCRWQPDDIVKLRKVYCKNGTYRPREWIHITVVVFLLNVACLAQYALCGIYWGYRSSKRPEFAEIFFLILGIAAPVLAGTYTVYSPLGREYDSAEWDGESQVEVLDHKREILAGPKLGEERIPVSRPEWNGGLFDIGDDVPVALLSFFCTCCVFGWNMGRLGFGNTYVHIATFILLFIAPYWIFSTSAERIHSHVVRHVVRIIGLVLSLLCLLYGGFWRNQIRRRFKLPAATFCCRDASLTGYAQWMFFWSCSLAQEVRTGNIYDVEEDSLYRKRQHGSGGGDSDAGQPISPRPAVEWDVGESSLMGSSDVESPGGIMEDGSRGEKQLSASDGGPASGTDVMVAPSPLTMQLEDPDCGDGRGNVLISPDVGLHVQPA